VSDRVAVVVGGAGAIGAAIVRQLRESGARAITLDLDVQGSDSIACDVRDAESVAYAFAKLDRIDMVVYAAGITRESVIWKLSIDDWDAIHSVNLRGAFLVLREAIPILRRGDGGSIVLIGSINGSRGKRGTAAYSASKAGLIGLAKSVARETGRFGITVNVVEPGWVRTPMTEALPNDVQDAALADTLLGAFVEPDDVAAMVAFLCSTAARRITGQVLRVDAGQLV
jgi:Dehydrogenases with different specificities (related to short-chain alcohol dehydrogenases)